MLRTLRIANFVRIYFLDPDLDKPKKETVFSEASQPCCIFACVYSCILHIRWSYKIKTPIGRIILVILIFINLTW